MIWEKYIIGFVESKKDGIKKYIIGFVESKKDGIKKYQMS